MRVQSFGVGATSVSSLVEGNGSARTVQEVAPCDLDVRLHPSPAQRPKGLTVAQNQRLFLRSGPAFQLSLARDRACSRGVLLGVGHADGSPF